MSPDDIREELTAIVREKLRYDGPLADGDLASQLDSVQRLTLVIAIEDHFKVCFDPDDEQQIQNLDDLLGLIKKKVESA